jgi:hypothetical protein
MQYLVMQTAVPVDLETGDWQDTSIGLKYSHTFGYGKIDSWATIEAAKTFKNVKPQAWYYSPWIHVNQAIPQGLEGLVVSFEVYPEMLKTANLERLEHVTVTMSTREEEILVSILLVPIRSLATFLQHVNWIMRLKVMMIGLSCRLFTGKSFKVPTLATTYTQ